MEIKRLCADDYKAIIELLDSVFSRKYNREQKFELVLPKMCVADELHMSRHLGIKEDGKLCAVVGIYPLPTRINETKLLFSTVGNVATHWDYTGRGYMNSLMSAAMEELKVIGADASRLGGLRQRYNRFGYESCGSVYSFTLTPENVSHCFPSFKSDISFVKLEKDDTEALKYVYELYSRSKIAIDRTEMPNYLDVYNSLIAWQNVGYLAVRADGTQVGYIAAIGGSIAEWGAESTELACEMLCAHSVKINGSVSFKVAPYQTDELALFGRICEYFSISSPSHFKICRWDRVVGALLGLKASIASLPDGEWTLGIKSYGTIRMSVSGGEAACVLTDSTPDLTLDELSASRLLFGPLPPSAFAAIPPAVQAWLPLPLSWNLQDRV